MRKLVRGKYKDGRTINIRCYNHLFYYYYYYVCFKGAVQLITFGLVIYYSVAYITYIDKDMFVCGGGIHRLLIGLDFIFQTV